MRRLAAAALVAAVAIGSGLLLLRRGAREQGPRRAPTRPPAGASEAPAAAVTALTAAAMPTLVPVEVAGPAAGTFRKARAAATLPPGSIEPAPTRNASAPAPTASVAVARTVATPAARPPPTPARAILRREPPPVPVILPPVEVSNASASPRVAAEEPPHHTQRPPSPTAPAKTYAGSANVSTGRIELDGIVYNESSPTALINGRVVAPGGFVAGYTVVRIERDRVELKDENGAIILTLRK